MKDSWMVATNEQFISFRAVYHNYDEYCSGGGSIIFMKNNLWFFFFMAGFHGPVRDRFSWPLVMGVIVGKLNPRSRPTWKYNFTFMQSKSIPISLSLAKSHHFIFFVVVMWLEFDCFFPFSTSGGGGPMRPGLHNH